jgi:hypothetical protein
MTTKQFILFSSGVFLMGVLYSYFMSKNVEQAIEKSPRTEHYEYEDLDPHHKMKVSKHETWYGDTMLVTVHTTYFYFIYRNNK